MAKTAKNGLSYEELFARFMAKMNQIAPEYREPLGWLYVYRQAQDQRKRLQNRARQLDRSADKVFWAAVLPKVAVDEMDLAITASVERLMETEEDAAKRIDKLMRKSSWYKEVAVAAARGVGMSPKAGMMTAVKLLDAFVAMTRFNTIGQLMRYARLAPENGKAPKKASGERIKYNPKAFQALFDLTDQWNRVPECYWRQRWDYWKAYYREQHPDLKEYPDGRIHNMGRRKVMREFLHALWDLWRSWEAKQASSAQTVEEAQ